MLDDTSASRRQFMRLVGTAAAALVLAGSFLHRAIAALPHLSASTNVAAKALHYTDNARNAAVPHAPMVHCMMRQHYKGHMGEAWGPCAVFPSLRCECHGVVQRVQGANVDDAHDACNAMKRVPAPTIRRATERPPLARALDDCGRETQDTRRQCGLARRVSRGGAMIIC
ncbi:MAG: high-potential iron-sulfur protein [Rhodanobacteraceae bacterium]